MSGRTARYRSAGGGAGLVRVEVLVPPSGRDLVVEHAARLRRDHRQPAALSARLLEYHDEALRKHSARCLWNARPSRTLDGMRAIAARLRTYGGMDAWRLAALIREELRHAAG